MILCIGGEIFKKRDRLWGKENREEEEERESEKLLKLVYYFLIPTDILCSLINFKIKRDKKTICMYVFSYIFFLFLF